MASLNRVLIIGNLGQDPELRYTQSQQAVCTLSVATTDVRNSPDGQRQEFTEWHRVVVWGKTAENCSKFLAKGRSVFVEGRLTTRSWEDKQGQKRYVTEIVAQNVQFLGGGARGERGAPGEMGREDAGGGYGGGGGSGYGNSNSYGASSNGGYGGGRGYNRGQSQTQGGDDHGGGGDGGGFGGPDTPSLDDIPF